MTSNVIVKGMLTIVGLVVALVLMKSCNNDRVSNKATLGGGEPLTAIEQAATGIEADTPQDTVATLVNEVRVLKNQVSTLTNDNKNLINMESSISKRVSREMDAQKRALENTQQAAMRSQEERFTRLLNNSRSPVQSEGRLDFSNEPNGQRIGDTYWVEPLGTEARSGSLSNVGSLGERLGLSETGKKEGKGLLSSGLFNNDLGEADASPIPYFTIAKNSTLVNSTAMTALIGRVPIGGNVSDPYFFKVIIGKENLVANGHELPDVAYAIASGDSFGDWTLSCVRGKIYSLTFVFQDGTIRTFPKPEDIYEKQQKTKKIELGELSDAYGNPCVPGKKKSNAAKYLAGRVTASAAEAAAIAAAAGQTTQLQTIGGGGIGTQTAITGSRSKFVYNATLAGAAHETADWIRERQSQEFDAIYVKAGEKVAIHINEEITLDYDPQGRKTNYDRLTGREYRALD